ncbi:hypothetical protein K438DRAFT_1764602 [Mycena galopus ATCC 62051]|nr:hypothetical protein K438DRAFT_1764602 [Mycena galopus ATCC 62051]
MYIREELQENIDPRPKFRNVANGVRLKRGRKSVIVVIAAEEPLACSKLKTRNAFASLRLRGQADNIGDSVKISAGGIPTKRQGSGSCTDRTLRQMNMSRPYRQGRTSKNKNSIQFMTAHHNVNGAADESGLEGMSMPAVLDQKLPPTHRRYRAQKRLA